MAVIPTVSEKILGDAPWVGLTLWTSHSSVTELVAEPHSHNFWAGYVVPKIQSFLLVPWESLAFPWVLWPQNPWATVFGSVVKECVRMYTWKPPLITGRFIRSLCCRMIPLYWPHYCHKSIENHPSLATMCEMNVSLFREAVGRICNDRDFEGKWSRLPRFPSFATAEPHEYPHVAIESKRLRQFMPGVVLSLSFSSFLGYALGKSSPKIHSWVSGGS